MPRPIAANYSLFWASLHLVMELVRTGDVRVQKRTVSDDFPRPTRQLIRKARFVHVAVIARCADMKPHLHPTSPCLSRRVSRSLCSLRSSTYSYLNATIGSTLAARHTGMYIAASAATVNIITATP